MRRAGYEARYGTGRRRPHAPPGEPPVCALVEQGRAKADGDPAKADEPLGRLGAPDPGLAIVTP